MRLRDRLERLDRRIVYALMFVVVLVPLLRPVRLPLGIGSPARRFHATIEALRPGSIVVMPFDYDPGVMAEVHPMAVAVLRRLLEKRVRVIAVTLQPAGPPLADRAWAEVGPPLGRKYGVDFVNLGYKSGNEALILALGASMKTTFPLDAHGAAVDTLPLMRDIDKLGEASLLIEIAGTVAANIWVQQAQGRFHVPMVAGVVGVLAPEFFPYLQAGQVRGLLGGMAGAAEYEALTGHPGTATRGMDAQSLAHLLIVALIALGNALWFTRRKERTSMLLLCTTLALGGCGGRSRETREAREAPRGVTAADTVREGRVLVARLPDGPVSEVRLLRDTSGNVVAWGLTEFPEGTQVRATLLTADVSGTQEPKMLAVTTARVEGGQFSSQPLAPLSGPPPPGLVRVRLEASFTRGAQTDSVLAVTDRGRRYRGRGVTPAGDHSDWMFTMEAPL